MHFFHNISWILADLRDGLRGQPGRVVLAGLAIAVGVLALTLLLSCIMGLQQKSRLMVQELGANVLAVMSEGGTATERAGLLPHHQAVLQKNLPRHRVSATKRYVLDHPDLKARLPLIATDAFFHQVRSFEVQQGRFLDPEDVRERQHVCILSNKLAEHLALRPGDLFHIAPLHLRVVGIASARGDDVLRGAVGAEQLTYGDFFVLVPGSIPPLWHTRRQAPSPALDALFIQCPPDYAPDQTAVLVQSLLTPDSGYIGNLSFLTPTTLVQGIRKLQRTLQLTTGSISVLCLVLGSTTLMSLMIANVRERISEIGLRLSLGASELDIYSLFILEGLLTTMAAALLGSGAAHLLLILSRAHIVLPLYLGWATVLVPVITSLALAILFSYGPARHAAQVSPAHALRNE